MKKTMVVSHERAGTHFLMNSIAMNFNFNQQRIDVHCKDYIYPEQTYIDRYKKEIEQFFEKMYPVNTTQIFKSHHQFGYVDTYFDKILNSFNVIYITRDPRDILASCFRYFNEAPVTAFPKCETIEEFLFDTIPYLYPYDGAYSYVRSENMVERIDKHIQSWKPVFDKVHVVKYEDMKEDIETEMKKISEYLNTPLSSDFIRTPDVGFNSIHPGKGISGGWRNVMSEELGDKILNMLKEVP